MTLAEQELFNKHLNSLTKLSDEGNTQVERPRDCLIIKDENNDYTEVFTVSSEEHLKFKKDSVSQKIFKELEQGKHKVEATLDLHGMFEKDASEQLYSFLKKQYNLNAKVIKIIHGKAANKDKPPAIKNMVNRNLSKISQVLAFCSARSYDGGTGAIYVLLHVKRR